MFKTTIIVGFLSLVAAFSVHAQDSVRIDQLEKEIQELKIRVSELESMLSSPSSHQEVAPSSEGWKSIANWRSLSTDMGPDDVKKLLGEPHRIDGGKIAFWYYQNNGQVTFLDGKVHRWTEPQ